MNSNSLDFLTYNELFEAIENDASDNHFKTAANFLESAVTDWPTFNLKEPRDLIKELKGEIKDKLTYDNLDKYLKNLKPNNDAWKIEAVNTLLEMFDFNRQNSFDKTIELEKIIENLTLHYRKKSSC